jgi:hypothetical protein
MKRIYWKSVIIGNFFALFLIFAICAGPAVAENRLIRPGGVYYHRFVSNVDAAEGLWINPAAIGQAGPIRFLLIGEYADDKLMQSWGGAVSGDRIGIGYRRLDDYSGGKYEEYTFGTGMGLGHYTFLGGSYTYVKHAEDIFNKKHFWNIGLMIGTSPQMKLGAVLSNLNRSRIDGEKSDIEQLYSISYRPQKLPVWISIEMSLSGGQRLSSADYTYGIEGSPTNRLQIYAGYRDGGQFEVGLTYHFDAYFGGAQTRISEGRNHLGTSLYGGYLLHPPDKR